MKRLVLFAVALFFAFTTTVMAEVEPLIQTDKDTYNYGEAIKVHFYDAPGYASDWICIVPAGSPDTEAGDYKYIPEGVRQGVLIFKSPRPGQYEARAYYNYSAFRYTVSDRYLFTIKGEAYGYNDDYVDVPIIYGEPYYLAPPIAVSFLFDYFTYELVNGFVDIVFWRGGHHYHQEHWYDNGRRVPDVDIRSRERHQRVRGAELTRHREQLLQNHNIFHPDSYYGLKSPSNLQMRQSQRPRQMEKRPQWGQRTPYQTQQRSSWEQQRPSLQKQTSRQVQQRPQQMEQRPQWGQRQAREVKQKPQQREQRPQSGQRQDREVKQPPRQVE